MLNQITVFGVISLINFLTCIFIGSFLLLRSKGSPVNISYCIFDFCIAFYAFFYFLWQSSSDQSWGILFFKWCIFGVVLINSAFVHFTFVVLNLHKKHLKQLLLVHVINAFFCFGSLFLFYNDWVIKYTYGLWPIPSNTFHFYITWWFIQVIYCFYLLYQRGIRQSTGKQRKQYQWIFWATLIAYAGGATNWFVWYGINFPPYLNSGIAIYTIVLAYAIFRHQLLGIEVIIKKTLVFAGLSSFVVACFSIPLFLLPRFFARSITEELQLWLLIAAGMVVAALVGPVNRILTHATDKFLFQKKHEIKVILKNLSERVVTVLDLSQVGKTILSTLEEAFRLESGMMFIRDKKAEKYRLLEYFGLEPEEFANGVKKYFDQPDINGYFENHRLTLMLDYLDATRLPEGVGGWLKAARARVCVPLLIDEDLTGILVLGKKKSDQEFSQEEIDFFPTIESQVSLAIRNARLIETVVEEREAKVAAEHLAKRVEFAGLIKHEIQNKLVHIEMPANGTATYCVPRLKKSFKEQNEELFFEMCNEIAEGSKKINFAANRIRIIAQTAKGGVDEKDESFQELDCKVVWEDAKKESGLLNQCDFESKMPDGFTVYGNYHALQRTFVNLITNAYDAMKGKDEPLIKLRCSYENMEGKRVAYFEVEDSGCGIPKEIHGKIFKDGFSTKPKPDAKDLISSGHGQGLAACKLYVESIHNGKMWFESEVDKGTTFKFWVPIKGNDARNSGG